MRRSAGIILLLVWPFYLNDLYLAALGESRIGLLWGLDLIFYVAVPTTTLACLVKTGSISLREIGLDKPVSPASVFGGIALCAFLVCVIRWGVCPVLRGMLPAHLFAGYRFPETQPLSEIVIVYAAATAGVLEEVIYRGVITSLLAKHMASVPAAVLLSCLIFAGAHWGEGPAAIISTFLWAVIPTIWVLRTRTLWGPITCHALYDLLVMNRWV